MKATVLCWLAAIPAGYFGCWWGLGVLVWLGVALGHGNPFRMVNR